MYISLDKSGGYLTHSKLPAAVSTDANMALSSTLDHDSDADSENLSEQSEYDENSKTKTFHFRASDPQVCNVCILDAGLFLCSFLDYCADPFVVDHDVAPGYICNV